MDRHIHSGFSNQNDQLVHDLQIELKHAKNTIQYLRHKADLTERQAEFCRHHIRRAYEELVGHQPGNNQLFDCQDECVIHVGVPFIKSKL